jgi:hypothetical protein
MTGIKKYVPYLTLLMAGGMILFTILDGYNPCMEWLTSEVSKLYIWLFCGVSAGTAVLFICASGKKCDRK